VERRRVERRRVERRDVEWQCMAFRQWRRRRSLRAASGAVCAGVLSAFFANTISAGLRAEVIVNDNGKNVVICRVYHC
jgi:hypothetical protein